MKYNIMLLLPSSTFKSQNEKSCTVDCVFFTNTLCHTEFFMVTASWKKINLKFDPVRKEGNRLLPHRGFLFFFRVFLALETKTD